MTPKNKQPFKRIWSDEEKELIKKYYCAIKTTSLIDILGRGSIKGINQKFSYYGWEPNEPLYGMVEVEYQGKIHLAKGFTYTKEGNSVKNKTVIRTRTNKKREVKLLTVKPVKERKKDHNPFKQTADIKPFVKPEGKVLTLVSHAPKTWKYQ